MLEEIKKISSEFFEKMWIKLDSLEVIQEWENIFFLRISTQDSGLLIWNHWTVFEAIQSILRLIFTKKFGKTFRFHFEINDYVHNKDEKLFAFINREIARAKETGRNMKLPKFSAYERKKIHDYVWTLNDDEIMTESRWEKEERRLYIILKKNIRDNYTKTKIKLEIDIDWDDI